MLPTRAEAPKLYASGGLRLGALLLDFALFEALFFAYLIGLQALSETAGNITNDYSVPLMLPLFGVYCALLESSPLQGTLFKRVLGMRVVDADGARISPWRAAGRYLGKLLSTCLAVPPGEDLTKLESDTAAKGYALKYDRDSAGSFAYFYAPRRFTGACATWTIPATRSPHPKSGPSTEGCPRCKRAT